MTATPRRAAISGPEWWSTVADASWSHFDRWFAIVGVVDFEGDLDELEADLVGHLRSSLHSRGDMEAKLSHLADLRRCHAGPQIDAFALLAADEPDKATVAKAHRKVLDQGLEDRAMTPAMRDTPHARLNRRALYGHWDRFPVNPDRWYEKLAGRRPAAYTSKGRTFALTRQLGERLDRLDGPRRAEADRLALYRAFHTVGVELAVRGDDSYGNIGDLRVDTFGTYLGIDWETSGMAPEHWWQDLCELLVSEVYALTYRRETLAFRQVSPEQADLVERILLGLADEWRAAYQDYQADQALELVAWLHIGAHRYSRYTSAARRIGSDQWRPVVALAESAVEEGHTELAVEVFRAADRPGMHRDHLGNRCVKLTGVRLGETPSGLRVVK